MNIACQYSHVWNGMFTKCHIGFFTCIYDSFHCSGQLCKNPFHWGWWIYYFTRPYNATHREITLLHGHEPFKLHDPIIITFEMLIFAIIVGLHIIWNMLWVCKHVTQPSMMWSIPCSTVMNDIFLNNKHAKIITNWCLHMLVRNAHSHVQQHILVNGNFTS